MMIKRVFTQPILIAVALFVGMLIVGNAVMTLTETQPEDLNTDVLTAKLLPFRLGLYVIVVGAWQWLAPLLARPRTDAIHEDMTQEMVEQKQAEITELSGLRWHVAAFFALFELIFIQRIFA